MTTGSPWVGTVIDVSQWQQSLPDLSGVIGVIARAGLGTRPDPMFAAHIAAARKAGLWVGSYWYSISALNSSDQVRAYINAEAAVGDVSLHVLDWEGLDGQTAIDATAFIRIYKALTGKPIGLYASESRFTDMGQDFNWIANYSQEPVKQYDMWQYGLFRGVDGNHARQGILDIVNKETNVTQAIITDTTPKIVTKAAGTPWYDLDGTTSIAPGTLALSERPSPYGVGAKRAIFGSINGQLRVALIIPATVADVPPSGTGSQADAVSAERERIAVALGSAEATKVRNT